MRSFYAFTALLLLVLMNPFGTGTSFGQSLPKFSGLMFGDYYYMVQNHDQTQKNMQAFDYRRIYLTADYDLAQDFTARFRLESDPSASSLPNGKLSTMLKDAFIKWKNVVDGGNIIIGLQGTPEINIAEGIFGYRSLEKTIQDLHGISASRDLGVSYNQKFSDAFMAGLFVGNNSGNSVPSNRYKAAYLYLQLTPVKGLVILLNGQYNGAGVDAFNRTGDVIVNYSNSSFSIGGQYFLSGKNSTGGPTIKKNGLSLNGWVALMDNIRFVARYDNYTPDADQKNTTIANSVQDLVLGGLDFSVRKNVHLMPNVEYTSYGLSGSKADVLARVTFYITF